MKKLFFITTIFCFSIFIGKAQENTKISGVFNSNISEKTIIFENYTNPTLFSKNIEINDNKFEIKFTCEKEDIYKLKTSNQNFLALVVNPGDNIKLKLNAENLGKDPIIEGSIQTKRVYDITKQIMTYKAKNDSLQKLYNQVAMTDLTRKTEIEILYEQNNNAVESILATSIKENIGDISNLFFIENLNIDKYYSIYASLDSAIYPKYSYNPVVANLHNKINASKATAIGSKAQDIKQLTPQDESLNLYSIKGKIIIVDFWASWCRPCRMENPNLVKLYNDYHDKGLEIFGVSLDKNKTDWVNAISNDKLTWYHVSDLKYWNNEAAKLYGVGSIPNMFVLDADYNIIAKNLRGEELRRFIAERLK